MKWIVIGLGILLAAAALAYVAAGMARKPMDEAARAKAPGDLVQVSAGRLHVRRDGPADGPVVVMVHGFSTPNFIFEQNVAALTAAGLRVIRFDHFGRGWSDRPMGPYDTDFYDRALLELMDAEGLTAPVGLVGLSMGGPIVAEFAARHPERVSGVFLFVPAGFDVAGTDSTAARLVRTPLIGDLIWRVAGESILLGDPQYQEEGLEPENRLAGDVAEQMQYRGYFHALLSTMRHMKLTGRENTFARLAETGLPVAALFGADDPTVLVSSAARLEETVPAATVHVLEGADHGLNYKRHADANPLLVTFFTEGPGTPAR
ncbi:alpha/beta fold hydrolase [Pyruvatibacter mobilis]|uniref:alpha/beta fold hydrolase n=1 Tax=Pyruvatibacter mobilis TaxID=1712261 RepID=UPI003BAEE03E